MEEVLKRLQALVPTISEICRISGTPGASIGVLYKDSVIFTHNHGYRDVKAQLIPDENTIYYLGSLTKSFTAAGLGILVDENKLSWDSRVRDILPDFRQVNQNVEDQATIADFLSHRTGLAPKSTLWLAERAGLAFKSNETLNVVSYLETIHELRSQWLYNNWGYALAGLIVEKLSGEGWGDFLARRIFEPLGLSRTRTRHDTNQENVAQAYMALSDGSPLNLPRPRVENGTIMEGAAGLQSSVGDLLKYSQILMKTAEQPSSLGIDTRNSPFRQVQEILKGHMNLSPTPSEREQSYAFGWIRTMLPNPLGTCGLNPMYVEAMPIVGKGLHSQELLLHHQGSLIDFLASIHLIPRTRTAIVVLTNSMAKNDAADWLGQAIVETILDNSDKNDYVTLAKDSAKRSIDMWSEMAEKLEASRVPNTPQRKNSEYTGSYYNVIKDYYLNIYEEGGQLLLCHQGDRSQSYHLNHFNYDSFSWLLTRDENARRGLFPNTNFDFYILSFGADEHNQIDHVVWRHDPSVPQGETFRQHGKEQEDCLAQTGKQNVLGPKG